MQSVAVIGGGLAGLSAAWRLKQAGAAVRLVEQSTRVGGVVGRHRADGYLFERGPTTVPAASPTLSRLIHASELQERIVLSRPACRRRYVWSRGCLRRLPADPFELLRSDLMSWRGKLRLFAEPFVRSLPEAGDETLAEFFRRRLGAETVRTLADPLVCGVFAGRPEELGSDAFPRLRQWERDHGSLFRALLKNRTSSPGTEDSVGTPGTNHSLVSFPNGMQELTDALAHRLGDCVELESQATAIEQKRDGSWRVHVQRPASSEALRRIAADAVILALTAPGAAVLLEPLLGSGADHLAQIPHAPVAVVGLGYTAGAVGHPLDGFGLLCASDSPLATSGPVLGVLFSSSVFPGRAPVGSIALTVMLGGTRDPEALSLSDEALAQRAQDACRELLDISESARVSSVTRWPQAIPQYLPGHLRRIDELEQRTHALGQIRLAGSYLRGVGIEATALSGIAAAESLLGRYPASHDD